MLSADVSCSYYGGTLVAKSMRQVQLRMDSPTYQDLKRAAKTANESINRYAVKVLKAALEPKP